MAPGLAGQTWMAAHSEGFHRDPGWRTWRIQLVVVVVRLQRLVPRDGRLNLSLVTCKVNIPLDT